MPMRFVVKPGRRDVKMLAVCIRLKEAHLHGETEIELVQVRDMDDARVVVGCYLEDLKTLLVETHEEVTPHKRRNVHG